MLVRIREAPIRVVNFLDDQVAIYDFKGAGVYDVSPDLYDYLIEMCSASPEDIADGADQQFTCEIRISVDEDDHDRS